MFVSFPLQEEFLSVECFKIHKPEKNIKSAKLANTANNLKISFPEQEETG